MLIPVIQVSAENGANLGPRFTRELREMGITFVENG